MKTSNENIVSMYSENKKEWSNKIKRKKGSNETNVHIRNEYSYTLPEMNA